MILSEDLSSRVERFGTDHTWTRSFQPQWLDHAELGSFLRALFQTVPSE